MVVTDDVMVKGKILNILKLLKEMGRFGTSLHTDVRWQLNDTGILTNTSCCRVYSL